jgi:hypothetical protein
MVEIPYQHLSPHYLPYLSLVMIINEVINMVNIDEISNKSCQFNSYSILFFFLQMDFFSVNVLLIFLNTYPNRPLVLVL